MREFCGNMGQKKEIKYRHPENGIQREVVDDVENVNIAGQHDGEYSVIIVQHSSGPNTLIEPVTDLYGSNSV